MKLYPVILPAVQPYYANHLKFWNKNSLFYYPQLLLSTYYCLKEKITNLREQINIEKEVQIIADSGGFQMSSETETYSPYNAKDIIEWQQTNNVQIGFILDKIPRNDHTKHFNYCLLKTNENINEATKYWNGSMLLYNILQGSSVKNMELWYKTVSEYKLSGWCVGGVVGEPNNFKIISKVLFLLDKGVRKNIHVLGQSNVSICKYLAYMNNDIENITFDSSSYSFGGRQRTYVLPILDKNIKLRFGKKRDHNLKRIPCDCPFCSKIDDISFYDRDGDNIYGSTMDLHNLFVTVKQIEKIDCLGTDKELMRRVFKTEEDQQMFDYIDLVVEKGFDYAYQKNINLMNQKNSSGQQKNLFNWG